VLALFNDYLTKVLRGLEPSMWRWVAYEDLCEAWGASDFEAADEIAEFLGLPPAPLSRAFRYFKPSRKDAASEMSPENLRTLRDLDSRKGSSWFPSLFPQQRLLRQLLAQELVVRQCAEVAQSPATAEGSRQRGRAGGHSDPGIQEPGLPAALGDHDPRAAQGVGPR
ncbi:ubiE, partial [Symbiodinium microadriaticum]